MNLNKQDKGKQTQARNRAIEPKIDRVQIQSLA